MEDSSHEQIVDQPTTESKMNRRDMAKLLGAVTALSASLGATFVASAQVLDGAQLQLQFRKLPPNGDTAKGELVCTINVSPADQQKLAATEAPVELRIVRSLAKTQRRVGAGQVTEIVVSSHTMHKDQWQTIKVNDLKND